MEIIEEIYHGNESYVFLTKDSSGQEYATKVYDRKTYKFNEKVKEWDLFTKLNKPEGLKYT